MTITDQPFYVDSGATVHISPYKSDFITLQPITPKAIKGVGGSAITACGVGNIKLRTAKGDTLMLEDALYVPNSTVRLISVSHLSISNHARSTFDSEGVQIINKSSGSMLAQGPLVQEKKLYTIDLSNAVAEHAYSTHQGMDITTWHRRLGHANYKAIQQLAHDHRIKGALTLPHHNPPKCDNCLLGKQTRTPVPKLRQEGHRAKRKLEIVWVDLMGPVNVQSKSGNHYVLDIVDDFTSMPWSIPLRNKSDAFSALKAWELARSNECGLNVGKYRTGFNGELNSDEMEDWLKKRGTVTEHSAPYTSAHVGRVERMHRTLMGKARTMRLESDCPEYLWDEFYLTAAHLHAKTPTKSLNGKTPHELWFDRCPDYSYMREIGCRAFVFIPTHNPKVKARSIECVLIGYGHNSKTYRCWDKERKKVYQSYHVKFIERHESPLTLNPKMQIVHKPNFMPASTPVPSLQDLDQSASLQPQEDDDDLAEFEIGQDIEVQCTNQDDGPSKEENVPRRSSRLRQPTEKAATDSNRPKTRLERVVEQAKESERRVKDAKLERMATVEENRRGEVTEAGTEGHQLAHTQEQAPAPTHDSNIEID